MNLGAFYSLRVHLDVEDVASEACEELLEAWDEFWSCSAVLGGAGPAPPLISFRETDTRGSYGYMDAFD